MHCTLVPKICFQAFNLIFFLTVHFTFSVNTGKLLCMSTLFLPILASPIRDVESRSPDKLDKYAEENLKWHEFDLASLFKTTDNDTDRINARDWSQFSPLGKIREYYAEVSCIESGNHVAASKVMQYIPQACGVLDKSVPFVRKANEIWAVWKATHQTDKDNNPSSIDYRHRTKGENPPVLTASVCKMVYKALTKHDACVEDDGTTQGATMSIRRTDKSDTDEWKNEFQIGFDPNEQKEEIPLSPYQYGMTGASCKAP